MVRDYYCVLTLTTCVGAIGCFDAMFVVVMAGATVRSCARTRPEALPALGVQGVQAQDRHGRPKESGYAP